MNKKMSREAGSALGRNKKTIGGLILAAAMLMLMPVLAWGQSVSNTSAEQNSNILVIATVNIYDAKIVSQSGNEFKLSFDFNNRAGVQPNVKYAVQLVSKLNRSMADEKVYDEILNLGENQTISKTITYSAPAYLNGSYEVWIISQNENGLPLGQGLAGVADLKGDSQYVEIQEDSCYITVSNEAKKYQLLQGVDISKGENLSLSCRIKNNYKLAVIAVPQIELFNRTTFGAKILSQNQEAVSFKAGETKIISLAVPIPEKAQAYDGKLTFSKDGAIVSDGLIFHFVLKGGSATIQNLVLDKDYYQKGDIANISFFWTGAADTFQGSRSKATDIGNVTLNIQITNGQGESCADPVKKETQDQKVMGKVDFTALITRDCANPKLAVSIIDKNGNVLDKNSINLKSQNILTGKPQLIVTEKPVRSFAKYVVALVLVLLVISLVLIIVKRFRKNSIGLFLAIFVGMSALSLLFASGAKADTFTVNSISDIMHGDFSSAVYSVSLNKASYQQLEQITATATTIHSTYCLNGRAAAGVDVSFNTTNSQLFSCDIDTGFDHVRTDKCAGVSGSVSGPAQDAAGNYQAVFTGYAAGIDVGPLGVSGTHSMPYAVVPAPTYNLSASKAGTGTGTITSNPAGIDCGTTCDYNFVKDSGVTLAATPATGSTFTGWSGACSGVGACSVVMDADKTVAGTFSLIPPCVPDGTYTCDKTNTGNTCTTANCGKNIVTNIAICKDNPCGNEVANSLCGSDCVGTTQTCPSCGGSSWQEVAP